MIIAVTSQNLRTITGHAGKTRRFLLYKADPAGDIEMLAPLELPREMAFHSFRGEGAHPLDIADLVITSGCGEGFVRRMAARGIAVARVGEEMAPQAAAEAFVKGRLPPIGLL